MTPRILHIIPNLDRAGSAKQLCLLTRELARTGFDTHVCVLAQGGPMVEPLQAIGIRPTLIEKRWPFDLRTFWNLKRLVNRLRPHLIHAWRFPANAYALAATLGNVKRLVTSYRSIDPIRSTVQLQLEREIGRRCAGLVTNSPGVKDFYVENGLPVEKFRIIPNGVEIPLPPSTTRRQILDELNLPEESRLVGLVGRLVPQKRVKDAIWATDLLKVVRKDVHLLVFGDGPHRDRLRMFREQVRIRDHVHFLGERSDLPRFLPHLDLLWSTSAYGGQSNAILEAMAAAIPVVASDIPGTRDLISHNQTGLLVQVGNRAGFARETHRLLENRELANRLGQAGRELVEREYTVVNMVEKYRTMYEGLL